jgi:hypothetical protein
MARSAFLLFTLLFSASMHAALIGFEDVPATVIPIDQPTLVSNGF